MNGGDFKNVQGFHSGQLCAPLLAAEFISRTTVHDLHGARIVSETAQAKVKCESFTFTLVCGQVKIGKRIYFQERSPRQARDNSNSIPRPLPATSLFN